MYASSFLALLGAASMASALPTDPIDHVPSRFIVKDFTFGFTSSIGYYSGQFSVPGYANPVTCKGPSNDPTRHSCEAPTNGLSTYLTQDPATSEYTLHAVLDRPGVGEYFGEAPVYSQTGPEANKAKSDFEILVTSKTA